MNDPCREFDRTLREVAARVEPWRAFADFCEMAALSLSNAVVQSREREERYLAIVARYDREDVHRLASLLGIVASALDTAEPPDFLGETFMRLGLSSHWHGQFFTPMTVARAMARLLLGDAGEIVKGKGYVAALEPACGSGAMVIGLAGALWEAGINYQRLLHVTAVDIDSTAAHMAHIQLSLLHIPAVVYVGDSLSMKMRGAYATPAHHLGGWEARLRLARPTRPPEGGTPTTGATIPPAPGQMSLF